MGLAHSPRIVTNGLVLCLDAGNTKSYPGSGTTWSDLSRRGNNGTLTNGPTFSSANKGVIVFDGTNDFIQGPSFNFGAELTVSCFVKPNTASNIRTIFSNSLNSFTANGIRLFYNSYETSDKKIFLEVGNGGSGVAVMTASDTIVIDSWQQITFTLSKNTTTGIIYRNYEQVASGSISNGGNYNTSGSFRIGAFGLVDLFYINGSMSNCFIYNRALSATEVAQNFNALRGRFGI